MRTLSRHDRRVVLQRAGRSTDESFGAQDDLIDLETVFLHLHANRLRPLSIEVNIWTEAAEPNSVFSRKTPHVPLRSGFWTVRALHGGGTLATCTVQLDGSLNLDLSCFNRRKAARTPAPC